MIRVGYIGCLNLIIRAAFPNKVGLGEVPQKSSRDSILRTDKRL